MSGYVDVVAHIDSLLDEARRQGKTAVRVRVGEDLKAEFEDTAGAPYERNAPGGPTYFGLPISFDTIDPTVAIVETEG